MLPKAEAVVESTMGELEQYLRDNAYVKALIKGPPGDGKTVLAGQVTHLWKTLYADVEGGIVSAARRLHRGNTTLRIVRETEHEDFFTKLNNVLEEADNGEYECLVVDTMTEIASRMEDEYALQGESGHTKWSGLLERVARFGRRLRDLKMHVICVAHTKTSSKEDPSSQYEVGIPGQSSQRFPAFFDVIGVVQKKTEKGKNRHVFVTNGPSIMKVRDRWDALSPEETIHRDSKGEIWKKLYDGMVNLALEK